MTIDDLWQAIRQMLWTFAPGVAIGVSFSGAYFLLMLVRSIMAFDKGLKPAPPTEAELEAEAAKAQYAASYWAGEKRRFANKQFHATSRKARQGRIR